MCKQCLYPLGTKRKISSSQQSSRAQSSRIVSTVSYMRFTRICCHCSTKAWMFVIKADSNILQCLSKPLLVIFLHVRQSAVIKTTLLIMVVAFVKPRQLLSPSQDIFLKQSALHSRLTEQSRIFILQSRLVKL